MDDLRLAWRKFAAGFDTPEEIYLWFAPKLIAGALFAWGLASLFLAMEPGT